MACGSTGRCSRQAALAARPATDAELSRALARPPGPAERKARRWLRQF